MRSPCRVKRKRGTAQILLLQDAAHGIGCALAPERIDHLRVEALQACGARVQHIGQRDRLEALWPAPPVARHEAVVAVRAAAVGPHHAQQADGLAQSHHADLDHTFDVVGVAAADAQGLHQRVHRRVAGHGIAFGHPGRAGRAAHLQVAGGALEGEGLAAAAVAPCAGGGRAVGGDRAGQRTALAGDGLAVAVEAIRTLAPHEAPVGRVAALEAPQRAALRTVVVGLAGEGICDGVLVLYLRLGTGLVDAEPDIPARAVAALADRTLPERAGMTLAPLAGFCKGGRWRGRNGHSGGRRTRRRGRRRRRRFRRGMGGAGVPHDHHQRNKNAGCGRQLRAPAHGMPAHASSSLTKHPD